MAVLTTLEIKPDATIAYVGDAIQYQALAIYDDGSVVDVTESAVWTLVGSPLTVAEFDATTEGLLLSKSAGTETIYADYGGLYDSTSITIHNPLITELQSALEGKYRPVVQDYLNLITSQYQTSPKFLHWVRTYLEVVEDIRELALSLPLYFSFNQIIKEIVALNPDVYLTFKEGDFTFVPFDACVGDQLDIVGIILGQPRRVNFNPTDGSSPILDDDTYRLLLKNKAFINQWDGLTTSLNMFWQATFPGGGIVIQDNQNMTVDVTLTGALTSIISDLIVNNYIIPRPQGVKMNYYYGTTPFFGFDKVDSFIAGFDEGNWA